MAKPRRLYSLLELYKNKMVIKNKRLGITYEVLYIPPDVLKRMEGERK